VNYLAKSLELLDTQSMSPSLFRRRVNRSTTPTPEIAPNPSTAAGAEAQFLVGLKFASGQGVAQDYTQAAQCYTEAAEQGHSLAQLNLAALYAQGLGVTRDETKALMWLIKAANLGNAAAQYRLGVQQHLACRTGRAEPAVQGRIEALKWVRLSAAQRYRPAQSACEFVALSMTRDEVAESARRAAAFVARSSA
jgi:TPR repeat protein